MPKKSTTPKSPAPPSSRSPSSPSSATKFYQILTIVGGLVFVIGLPTTAFMMHPILGVFMTTIMGFIVAKSTIQCQEPDKEDCSPDVKTLGTVTICRNGYIQEVEAERGRYKAWAMRFRNLLAPLARLDGVDNPNDTEKAIIQFDEENAE